MFLDLIGGGKQKEWIYGICCVENLLYGILYGIYYGILFMESVFIGNMFVVGLFGSGKFQQESG